MTAMTAVATRSEVSSAQATAGSEGPDICDDEPEDMAGDGECFYCRRGEGHPDLLGWAGRGRAGGVMKKVAV